jgi:hypothetical protein
MQLNGKETKGFGVPRLVANANFALGFSSALLLQIPSLLWLAT